MSNIRVQLKVIGLICFTLAVSNAWARQDLDQALQRAGQECERSVAPSRVGSCMEEKLTAAAPEWVNAPRARYVATLFPYADRGGEKLESGEWDRQQYEQAMMTFINRMKIQMAQDERSSNMEAFLRGLNSANSNNSHNSRSSSITCIDYGGIVQCR